MPIPSPVQSTDTFNTWLDATNNVISHIANSNSYVLVTNASTANLVSTGNVYVNGAIHTASFVANANVVLGGTSLSTATPVLKITTNSSNINTATLFGTNLSITIVNTVWSGTDITFGPNVAFQGLVTINAAATLTKNVALATSVLTITTNSTVNTLSINPNQGLTYNLNSTVSHITTNSTVYTANAANIFFTGTNLTIGANTVVNGTFHANNVATLGNTTVSGSASVSGNATLGGTVTVSGNATFNQLVSLGGPLTFTSAFVETATNLSGTGIASPLSVSANSTIHRITATDVSAGYTGKVISGIQQASTTQYRQLVLFNTGNTTLIFQHANTTAAANGVLCPSATDFQIPSNGTCLLYYDANISGSGARWRVISAPIVPDANTSVRGLVNTSAQTFAGDKTFQNAASFSSTISVTGNATFDTNTLFVDATNDRVGIGTTSPSQKLHVSGIMTIDNVGFLRSASNVFQIQNGISGTAIWNNAFSGELVRVLDSGNVGIGTSSPSTKLHVVGDVRIPSGNSYELNASGTTWMREVSANIIQFYANGAERMRIDGSTGNVGIGTTSPGVKLETAGLIRSNGSTLLSGFQIINNGSDSGGMFSESCWKGSGSSNNLAISAYSGNKISFFHNGGSTEAMTISTSGLVGIGTASPLRKLHVSDGGGNSSLGASQILVGSAANIGQFAGIGFGWQGSSNAAGSIGLIATNASGNVYGDLIFNTRATTSDVAPTERMRITGDGNVGIGTSSPQRTLDVAGEMVISTNSTWSGELSGKIENHNNVLYIQGGSGTNSVILRSSSGTDLATFASEGSFAIASGKKFYLDNFGDTYITESSADNLSIYVGGSRYLQMTGGQFYVQSSDIVIPSTRKFYLDGGSDTYIYESAANTVDIVAGGVAQLRTGSTYVAVMNGTLSVEPTKKFFLDGGSDTYIYEPSGNIIAAVTGGSERLRIDSSGNVGIGTSSPSARLSVDSSTTALTGVFNSNASSGGYIRFDKSGAEHGYVGNPDALTSAGGTGLALRSTGGIQFATGGSSTRVTIDVSGNVGIGTGGPDGKLDVNGTSYFRDYIALYSGKKLYLDGGSDTYMLEYDANRLAWYGGGTLLGLWNSAFLDIRTDVVVSATKKLYLDSGGDTYITESSGNVIALYAGGTLRAGVSTALWSGIDPGSNFGTGDIVASRSSTTGIVGLGTDASVYLYRTGSSSVLLEGADFSIRPTKKFYLDGGSDTYIHEPAADHMYFVSGGTTRLYQTSTYAGVAHAAFVLNATHKLYLDGGSDTYIYEAAANQINFVSGGTTRLYQTATYAGVSQAAFFLDGTYKLYLDGGSDTYIYEPSANIIAAVTGGNERLRIESGEVSITNTLNMNRSADGRFVLPVGADKWST